jgi:hypothetical protein
MRSRADAILFRGFRQLRGEPVPQEALERLRRALELHERILLPQSQPSLPFTASIRRSVSGLLGAVVLGGLAGLWVAQQNLSEKNDDPSLPNPPADTAKSDPNTIPIIRDQFGPPLWESQKPQSVQSGPVRVEIERVRLLKVPKKVPAFPGHEYLQGRSYVFVIDARLLPSKDYLSTIEFLIPQGLKVANVYPLLPIPSSEGDTGYVVPGQYASAVPPVWSDLPHEASRFQVQFPVIDPSGKPRSPQVPKSIVFKTTLEYAPRSALHSVVFTPKDPPGKAVAGQIEIGNGVKDWRVELMHFNFHLPRNAPYHVAEQYRAVAKIAWMEDTQEKYPAPKIAVAPPWRVFVDGRRRPPGWRPPSAGDWDRKLLQGESHIGFLYCGLDRSKNPENKNNDPSEAPPIQLTYAPSFAWKRAFAVFPAIPMKPVP